MNNQETPDRASAPVDSTRRTVLQSAAGLMAATLLGRQASAATDSTLSGGPVRIVVPQTPGTTPDSMARLLSPAFSADMGRAFVVENRPGASGMIGMEAVAKAAPDGHTLMSNVSTNLTLPFFYKTVPFDVLKSFQPVGLIGYTNFVLVINQAVPAKDLQEFLAYVRARPHQLNYGSPGLGTHHHLCMELLKVMTGIQIEHVPYKGSAGAITDLLLGQVQAMFLPSQLAVANAAGGRVRILGGTKKTRDPLYPDMPTLDEQGVQGFDVEAWYALWAPAGMSDQLVQTYNAQLQKTLQVESVRKELTEQGVSAKPGTPDELHEMAREEYSMWGRTLKSAGIQTA
jgi:tripartite-type tricarboxylate transporter receptor subunit TctC